MTDEMTDDWLAPHETPVERLPRPTTTRWQPLRLGLVDLFYYDDEQFWFHDGRLLLRGNNGTGKSKVLALTLPFLLDGSLHPRRVEPDADPKKRMEWNLLLGGEHPSSERTGYTWLELGRVDADGVEHFTTLAIGLKAAAGRGIVKHWYAVSSRRIGDLRLVDDNRVVLTQERLRDELAATGGGQVLTTAEAYRRLVDETLFRLGDERYAALVDLLIQLRQPQLSKRPDEKALSAALTEALAPLDQAVVADVAESFRSLEEERAGIAAARETHAAAAAFLHHYRSYAQVATRRRTTAVREANSAFEWAGRHLREAETAREEADAEVARLEAARTNADEQLAALRGQDAVLRQSPEMRSAEQLTTAGADATEMEERSTTADVEAEQARHRADREADAARAATQRWEHAVGEERELATAAARASSSTGLSREHETLVADERAATRSLERRRQQVGHVRSLLEAATRATTQAESRRAALDEAEARQVARTEAVTLAEAAVEKAAEAHGVAVRNHLRGLEVLVVADADDVARRSEEWAGSLVGEVPAHAAVDAALADAEQHLGGEAFGARQAVEQAEVALAEVAVAIADLRAGRDPEPPPFPGRAPRDDDRPGAPLWRLADFADDVTDDQRAGLEAALQSAGLLDAWVHPDGTVEATDDVALGPVGPEASPSLGSVLVAAPAPDIDVPSATVEAVLARIGLGEPGGAALWVDADGRWGAGPARGSWHKERAEHLGAGARETHRRARIVALEARAGDLEAERSTASERLAAALTRLEQARTEARRYPGESERAVTTAHADVASARRELSTAAEATTRAHESWQTASAAAGEAADELTDQAGDLALPATSSELDEVAAAVSDYAAALASLRTAARLTGIAAAERDRTAERSTEADALRDRRDHEAGELRVRATTVRARYDELQRTVGASVAELEARLAEVERSTRLAERTLTALGDQQREAERAGGVLQQKVADLTQRREETSAARDDQVAALRGHAATGLLRVALPDLDAAGPADDDAWHLTPALALARRAAQALDAVDESADAWARVQQRVSTAATELAAQMSRHGHTAHLEQRGEVLVSRVRYLGDELDVDLLADRLAADVADRERLLTAKEREILENHLVNEVAGHLHELLLAAEGQIDRMNRELADRKTSTGMQLRVRWREQADGPTGLATARALMLRSDATWTPDDRSAIGDFLQARIGEVRQADPTGGWQEHLEKALDYRQWHSFVVERRQHDQWRSASGPASGGEKVLAVSVPLFAAASAHYNSAGEHAPRLILLDEAFAGVDDDSRAKSLGLLATFDLDVVMTSEREWGCYPQVPGLAIAQLSRVEGIDAVGVTRWRWDGRRRQRVDEIDDAARAGGGAGGGDPAKRSADEASLFG